MHREQAVPPVAHAQPSPRSAGEALQARLDAAICVHLLDRNPAGGTQVIGNCFTSCDGTEMRQFVVSATGGVRCAICCGDASFARSSRTPPLTQLHDVKKHCGQVRERGESALEPQTQAHLEHLRLLLEGAPTEAPAEPDAQTEPEAPAEAPAEADDSDADDDGPWPRPGQVVEVVWTKKTTLEMPGDGGIDRCVVRSIREPIPDKKSKASVPEVDAYKCYAQLQSLIRLAGDTDQPYETVPESDPRPKHVHLKYKLDLAEKGRTWRIRVASSAATVSEEAPLPPPEDVDVVAPPVAEMAIEATPEEPAADPVAEPVAEEPEAASEATPTARPKRAREESESDTEAPGEPDVSVDDESVDGAASFPVGSWVRHATTGVKGVVVSVYDGKRSVLCDDKAYNWSLGMLQPAPGAPPETLAAVAAARYAKRGDWVRDEQTGKQGVIVEVNPKGRRTILCDNDEELKRTTSEFRIVSGAPPATLVAKAAAWRKTAKKKAPPPPSRKRAAPADAESSRPPPQRPTPQHPFAVGELVADIDAPQNSLEVMAVAGNVYTLRYRDAGAWRGRETTLCASQLMGFGAELPSRRRRTAAPPAPKKRAAPTPAPKTKAPPASTKKKPAAKKARRVTQTPAAKPSAAVRDAPEGAVFDHAAKLHGEWVSPRRPGGPKGPAPVWCLWREDFELMDDDDTPLKGAWEVKWSDRTASFLARDDVRLCVPTRDRLKAEAQAPTPPKRARRVTESPAPPRPRPPTPPPAPAPEPATDDDESYDEFGPGAKVIAPASDGRKYRATVVRAHKNALRVQWEDGAIDRAPRDECELQERAPRVRITDEEKREQRREQVEQRAENRAMAQHDKPALLLTERRAMGMEDKPLYRAAAARAAARPAERRDWCGRGRDYTALAHGLAMRARQEDRDTITGACARLDVGGVFLSSRFDSARQAAKALAAAAPSQRCVCGRSEGGDYVKCAGGANGRCHGFVHRRCVGLKADEAVPNGYRCPLCDDSVASKLSVHGGPLAAVSPLIGRVLLQTPGAEAAPSAPLLLRAVGARTRPEVGAADTTKPPPSGSRVAVKFDDGKEYEGTVGDVLNDTSAMIDFDDGQSDKFDFPDPDLRVISGSDVVVRCVALFGDGEESWEISEAAARDAALRRETAELHAISDRWARGAKHVFHTTTPNCEVCAHCLDSPRNGGPGTLKQACKEKDDERAIALLYLASGAPPPGGGWWVTHNMAEGAPSKKPRPAKSRSRPASFDPPTLDPNSDDEFRRGTKVVAPWVDGHRYSATVLRPFSTTVRVVFEDGTPHTVPRSELDLDDGVATIKERDEEEPSEPHPQKRPKPAPQTRAPPPPPPPPRRVAPSEPCAICMSMIDAEDAHWLECGHAFHTDCLRQMADVVRIATATRRSLGVSCPLCRKVTRAEVGAEA